jgi:hypothetical protein
MLVKFGNGPDDFNALTTKHKKRLLKYVRKARSQTSPLKKIKNLQKINFFKTGFLGLSKGK